VTVYDSGGWHQVPDGSGSGRAAVLAEIDPAYLPGLLRRLTPFERWVLAELYGHQHELADPVWRVRTVDEIAEDSGLPASRITEIAAAAVERMRGHGLAAD